MRRGADEDSGKGQEEGRTSGRIAWDVLMTPKLETATWRRERTEVRMSHGDKRRGKEGGKSCPLRKMSSRGKGRPCNVRKKEDKARFSIRAAPDRDPREKGESGGATRVRVSTRNATNDRGERAFKVGRSGDRGGGGKVVQQT